MAKAHRGLGFTNFEDEILCGAYLLNTTDGEIGAYQSHADMWKKIQTSYNHEAVDKHKLLRRTVKSLMSRWDKISPSCVLYGSCLTSVEARNQSGSNESEIIKQALHLYTLKEINGKSFGFIHCLEILKVYPKWAMPDNSQRGDGSSHIEGGTPISAAIAEDSQDTPNNEISAGSDGRGLGQKATKSRRKLHREKDLMWEEMMKNSSKTHQLLQKQLVTIDIAHQAKIQMEQKKLELKQKKLECKKRQMDMRTAEIEAEILGKNLANMTPFSKAYWTSKKEVVVDGMTRRSRASRSLNFSDDGSGGSNVGGDFSQNYDNSHINTDGRRNEGFYCPDTNAVKNVTDTYGGENELDVNNVSGTFEDLNVPWRLV